MTQWRKIFSKLGFQSIVPPLALLLVATLAFGWLAIRLTTHFSNLQTHISRTTEANESLIRVTLLRSQVKEALLLYEATGRSELLSQIKMLESERAGESAHLKNLITSIEPDVLHLEAFFAGTRESLGLRQKALAALANGQRNRARELIESFLILYRINSARMEDLHGFLKSQLTASEAEMSQLLDSLPYFIISLLLIEALGAYFIITRHRRRVLQPLNLIHNGLGKVARGNLGEPVPVTDAPTEIREMMEDFNAMTMALERTTRELDLARSRAERAARVKSEFLSNMSHEIRTPLNVIVGIADILGEKMASLGVTKEVNVLAKSSRMLVNIVNDILDYSRLESGRTSLAKAPFDLRSAIKEVASVLESLAREKGLNVKIDIDPSVPRFIVGDEFRLEQVLLNLINNAVKFTDKGEVVIHAKCEKRGALSLLTIKVSDTGIGISPENVSRIFSRFEQAEASTIRRFGGTGLGLAIVKQIVNLFGGEITVDSKLGHGTTFSVSMPVQAADAAPVSTDAAPEIPGTLQSPQLNAPARILLADDSSDNRFLIRAYLKNSPVEIIEAQNGQQALDHYKTAPFDAVLMDIQMPVKDGYDATREIRAWESEHGRNVTPIIALTAFSLPEEIERCREAGCTSTMIKPIRKQDLIMTLNRFFSRAKPGLTAESPTEV